MIKNKAQRIYYEKNHVRQNAQRRKYYRKHREAENAKRRKYYREHKKVEIEKALERSHMKRYGISRDQKYERLRKQGNRCAICGIKDSGSQDWHTDHDHKSKKIRGILCANCNHLLGQAHDNPVVLVKAADYLRRHNAISLHQ